MQVPGDDGVADEEGHDGGDGQPWAVGEDVGFAEDFEDEGPQDLPRHREREVEGIRELRFTEDGQLEDVGLFSMDVEADLTNEPYTLGVQP